MHCYIGMAAKRVVVIGASSGGIEALRTIAKDLPEGLKAAVCVVVHTAPDSPGVIDAIMNKAGPLEAVSVRSRERLEEARIYIAPPDHHLVIEPGVVRATKGPKENRARPAIDPLFRSAAQVFGPAAIGVVLTGSLDDGTAGLLTIKQLGGIAIVQDPSEALFPCMPRNALRSVAADHVVPLSGIAPLLERIADAPVEDRGERMPPDELKHLEIEVNIARDQSPLAAGLMDIAEPSPFSCPECHGVLLRLKAAEPARFRCHTGHGYSAHALVGAVNESIEEALWSAVRSLQEGSMLIEHLAEHLNGQDPSRAEELIEQSRDVSRQSETVRELLIGRKGLTIAPR